MPTFEKTPVAWLERWFNGYRLCYVGMSDGLEFYDTESINCVAPTRGYVFGSMFSLKDDMPYITASFYWTEGDTVAHV